MIGQMRLAYKQSINLNPRMVSYISGTDIKTETVRISHQSASVPNNTTIPVGLGTSFSYFLVMEHDSAIFENALIIHNGIGFRVGPVDQFEISSEVFGKRAPLTVVKPSTANLITSFKIGTVAGVINNTANIITVTLPIGTAVTSLTPVITHNGKLIDKIGAQDFTLPVDYTITAENLTTKKYTVTVVLA